MSSPTVWSICPSTSTMPSIALSRVVRSPCRAGLACSCARMSGEALTSAQLVLSGPHTAIEDWVRATVRSVPARSPEQLRQLQFHWGKPPPAADPRTRILTAPQARWAQGQAAVAPCGWGSASCDIQGDLHAKTEVDRLWYFPAHFFISSKSHQKDTGYAWRGKAGRSGWVSRAP